MELYDRSKSYVSGGCDTRLRCAPPLDSPRPMWRGPLSPLGPRLGTSSVFPDDGGEQRPCADRGPRLSRVLQLGTHILF